MSIRRTEPVPGYPVFEIDHPAARARVALHGAHLMEWIPTGHEPVIYLSPDAVLREGKAIRGGVPVCWPWFGPHPTDPALPAHGFARSRFWELTDQSETAEAARLTFLLTDDKTTRVLWPHAFHLELEMILGAELQLHLRMVNTGSTPFDLTAALHSYLAVGGIRQTTVTGLTGADYRDVATQPATIRHQEGDIHFDQETDRDYHSDADVEVRDDAMGRTLIIGKTGSHCTVVWNPWIEKAIALTDLPDDHYQNFVCVETANAWKDIITLAPGASHTLATTVKVR